MTSIAKMPHPTELAVTVRLPALSTGDLCGEFYNEPRIHDLLLAERLGFKRPADIRGLIVRNKAELEAHGALIRQLGTSSEGVNYPHRADNSVPARRGPKAKEFWLNEGQALTICALARTSAAARIRRELVTVFIAWRTGEPVAPVHIDPKVADLDAIGNTLGQMKAEIATLRRAVVSSVELVKEYARALEIAASASPKRLNGPKPAKAIRARTALLYGAEAIADYLGLTSRQVSHLHHSGNLPTFKVGGRVCADTTTLDNWMAGKAGKAVR